MVIGVSESEHYTPARNAFAGRALTTQTSDQRLVSRSLGMDTTTLLIIILVLFVLGGGFYGRGRWY
jgi:hypothetical protein